MPQNEYLWSKGLKCLLQFVPSRGNAQDLKTRDNWCDPKLNKYSFCGLVIVIATGFISHSLLPTVLMSVIWESSWWLGENIEQKVPVKRTLERRGYVHDLTEIMLKMAKIPYHQMVANILGKGDVF